MPVSRQTERSVGRDALGQKTKDDGASSRQPEGVSQSGNAHLNPDGTDTHWVTQVLSQGGKGNHYEGMDG